MVLLPRMCLAIAALGNGDSGDPAQRGLIQPHGKKWHIPCYNIHLLHMTLKSVFAVTDKFRLLLFVVAGVSAAAFQASGALGPVTDLPVQSEPSSIALGDVNGDTFQDLAVANADTLSISILLGNAAGNFGAATHFPTLTGAGRLPTSVDIHDMNGDNAPDLVIGTGGIGLSTTIQVMLGNGTGSFGTATTYVAGGDPWSVVAGDFTGDGKPDIATANRTTDNVSVLPGNGDGTFGAATSFSVGSFPTSIAAGDLNGDGHLDLATSNANTDNVSVLLSDGSGSFHATVHYPVGNYPFGVAIGNINGDNHPDIAVADNIDGTVQVLLNNGSGTFNTIPPFLTGAGAGSVAIGDLNNDTFADLAVANYFGSTVTVLSGTGVGTFVSPEDFPAVSPSFVVIGNLGSDSLPDLVYANEGANNVSVRLNGLTEPVINLGLNPASLEFGRLKVGTQSTSLTVTIVNNGSAGVPIEMAGIVGEMQEDFPFISSECDGITLPPGASCRVSVAFKPSVIGERTADLYIFLVGVDTPLVVPLSGTGIKARIGRVEVSGPAKIKKGQKVSYKVKITNSGNATATGLALKASGRGISAKTSVAKIAAGLSRTASVKFRPKRTGKIKVAFKVTSANAGSKTVKKTILVK